MITNFEEITATLTTYERDMLVPLLANYLKTRVGAKYAVRNKDMCRMFTEKGYQGQPRPASASASTTSASTASCRT